MYTVAVDHLEIKRFFFSCILEAKGYEDGVCRNRRKGYRERAGTIGLIPP